MLEVTALGWALTIGAILTLLAADLLVGWLRPHAVGFVEAAAWSVFYPAAKAHAGSLRLRGNRRDEERGGH